MPESSPEYLPVILTRKSRNTASLLSEPGSGVCLHVSCRKTAANKQKDNVLPVICEVKFKVTEQIGIIRVMCFQTLKRFFFFFLNICHNLMLDKIPHLFSHRANPEQNISHTTRPSHEIPCFSLRPCAVSAAAGLHICMLLLNKSCNKPEKLICCGCAELCEWGRGNIYEGENQELSFFRRESESFCMAVLKTRCGTLVHYLELFNISTKQGQ